MPARVILEPRLDGYERPCLQIVEAAVFHQCFDRFAGFGAFLNLIEDNQRFARCELLLVVELDVLQERAYVLQVLLEPILNTLRSPAEINKDE